MALTCLATAPALAADKITIMVGGIEKQIYLPAKLAEQLGYFAAEGIEVELASQPSGVEAENELLAGAVQGVVGFYDHCIDIQSKGKYIQSVVQFSSAPGEAELVATPLADQIKSPADFKGRSLGVTGIGSSTYFLTLALANRAGLKLSDFTILPVGAGNTFIAAMQQKKIDAGMTTEPTISRLLKTGEAQILVDLRTPETTTRALGGLYPAASLYMASSYIATHKVEVQKLANALVKTLRFMAANDAEAITDKMPKDYWANDRDLYVRGLAEGKAQFTADGRMPKGGPETVLAILSDFSPNLKGKTIDLSKTYTTEFVDAVK